MIFLSGVGVSYMKVIPQLNEKFRATVQDPYECRSKFAGNIFNWTHVDFRIFY